MPLSPSDRALGDLLVARRVISLPQLDEAVALAETWNVRLSDALLSRDWIARSSTTRPSRSISTCRSSILCATRPTAALLSADDADLYARRLTMPWRQRDGRIVIATAEPGPETVLFARQRWGAEIEFVVVSKFDIVWAVQAAFAARCRTSAVFELAELDPEMSARTVFTAAADDRGLCADRAVLRGSGVRAARHADRAQCRDAACSISATSSSRAFWSRSAAAARPTVDESIAIAARALRDDELPVFTVLVPMFREPQMLPLLAASSAQSRLSARQARHQDRARGRRQRDDRGRADARSRRRVRGHPRAAARSRRPSRRPAISRCASRAANIW